MTRVMSKQPGSSECTNYNDKSQFYLKIKHTTYYNNINISMINIKVYGIYLAQDNSISDYCN